MSNLATILFVLAAVLPAVAGESVGGIPTNAPARIALRDQFDMPQTLIFPTTNIVFLTIADKKGSEQIVSWVAPVHEKFKARIEIRGIADMSAVPKLLRGLVRRKFQNAQSYPVMLDWTGDTVRAFGCRSDQVNVFLLDGEGRILKHAVGPANEAVVRDWFSTMDQALGRMEHGVAK